jgi:hypothetical protein
VSTQVLEQSTRGDVEIGEVDHYNCCREDVAICGVDMRGWNYTAHDDPAPVCPLCDAAVADKMPCAAPGCPVGPGVFSRIRRWWRSR